MPVPAELTAALAADPSARTIFAAFAPSHQKEYAKYVAEAKQAATRQSRAAKSVTLMKSKAAAK